MSHKTAFLLLAVAVVLLVSCDNVGQQPGDTVTKREQPTASVTASPNTSVISGEGSIEATHTALPISTASSTPAPTASASPTLTPTPSPTIPPTFTPAPSLDLENLQSLHAGNVGGLQLLEQIGTDSAREVIWSADGRLMVLSTQLGVRVLDAYSLGDVAFIEVPNPLSVMFLGDTHQLLVAWRDDERLALIQTGDPTFGRVALFSGQTGELLHEFPVETEGIKGASLDRSGQLLAIEYGYPYHGKLVVLEVESEREIFRYTSEDTYYLIEPTFVPSSELLLAIDLTNEHLLAFSLSSGAVEWEMPFRDAIALDVNPAGTTAVIETMPGGVTLVNLEDRSTVELSPRHKAGIRDIEWSVSGDYLASASMDGTVIIWDAHSWQQKALIRPGVRPLADVSFSPDERSISTAGMNGSVQLWGIPRGELITSLTNGFPDSGLAVAVDVSPDGRYLAVGGRFGLVTVWNAETRQIMWTFDEHTLGIGSLDFSPDSRYLASASSGPSAFPAAVVRGEPMGGEVVVWDMETGEEAFYTFELNRVVEFTQNGSVLETCQANQKMLVEVDTWEVQKGTGTCKHPEMITNLSDDSGNPYECDFSSQNGIFRVHGDREAVRVFAGGQVATLPVPAAEAKLCGWIGPQGKTLQLYRWQVGILEIWGIPQ